MRALELAMRLIAIDTSQPGGVHAALRVVAEELAANAVRTEWSDVRGRPCLRAVTGSGAPRLILHGHVDVVPGTPEQFRPRVEGDALFGRGAYDMKAAVAVMVDVMSAVTPCRGCEVELILVPDEERADPSWSCTELLVEGGARADFVICGEPTDLLVGVQAKGVLMLRARVDGLGAHGSTPWLGRNAILTAVERYSMIQAMPFARQSSRLFAKPSINLGRISGGTAINCVADFCELDIDVRYLPDQDPAEVLRQIRSVGDWEIDVLLQIPPADLDPDHPSVRLLLAAVPDGIGDVRATGRDGASEAVAFLAAGIPAVEFGPRGAGHHGPAEYVDIPSLSTYSAALEAFVSAFANAQRTVNEVTPT
ncbi:MAG: M20/M25/M40 family metallo-hydrolase [Actinobacteria bacterium]|nr:M20/M25/M40 family metallo-hydrolase [Actinomycetota bacterium]